MFTYSKINEPVNSSDRYNTYSLRFSYSQYVNVTKKTYFLYLNRLRSKKGALKCPVYINSPQGIGILSKIVLFSDSFYYDIILI